MIALRNNSYYLLRIFSFLLLILFIFSIPAGAVKNNSFYLENNTGLNFIDGFYRIEVIDISKPGDIHFLKVNLTTGGLSEKYILYENEASPINKEPFNKIKLNYSFSSFTAAKITVEYPDNWPFPVQYAVEKTVISEKIPNLVITKSTDKIALKKGDVVEFTMIVENTGNGTAYNITLDDRFPPGFTSAPGSRFPPAVRDELKAGERIELFFALKAVESGSYDIEPTTLKYDSRTSKSNSILLNVLDDKIERSYLLTEIIPDKINIFTGELVEITVKISNNGEIPAESVLIEGQIPKGMEVTKGDLRQVYKKIEPGESEEYSATLKAVEAGNYSIKLKTIYSDDSAGSSSNSDPVIVTENEKNYLYLLIPAIMIIAGIALFVVRRHKEYSY